MANDPHSNDRNLDESSATFNALHEILRHALHKTEILGVAIQTLNSICSRKKIFDEERYLAERAAGIDTAWNKRCARKIAVYLDFQLSIVRSLEARARANEARIRSEITLVKATFLKMMFHLPIANFPRQAFSTVAQIDSRVQVEIGQAARKDSYTMVKIAAVTMLFLPPSFVSVRLLNPFLILPKFLTFID